MTTNVLLIAGSPTTPSRSSHLLSRVQQILTQRGVRTARLDVRNLPAQAMLHADFSNTELQAAIAKVTEADAVVIATPIYKAAYSGALKLFLDVLGQYALAGKTVLPLATGGSANHMLAIDYALRPVLQSLHARHVLAGVYATDLHVVNSDGVYTLDVELERRVQDAADALFESLPVQRASRVSAVG
ncbi:NADPH-dependent FMN reductase [soil metagenome]